MRINHYTLIVLFLGSMIVSSCKNDNEEDLYPNPPGCDTTQVTFAATILPILNESCIACHSGAAPAGNIALETYGEIKASALIAEGSYGSLYGSVSHAAGNSPMPKNGAKLSDCKIAQIKKWINEGCPNN